MTNYEKARVQVFEKIEKMVNRGHNYEETKWFIVGILSGFGLIDEFLTKEESEQLFFDSMMEVDSKF